MNAEAPCYPLEEITPWACAEGFSNFLLAHEYERAFAMNNPFLVSRSGIIALVVTLVTLPPLLDYFGIVGAAIANLVAYATQFFVVAAPLRSSHDFHFRSPSAVPPR